MVNQIFDFPGFAPSVLEEVQRTGKIGVWRGASVVTLKHYADEDSVSFMPANELWVLGALVLLGFGLWLRRRFKNARIARQACEDARARLAAEPAPVDTPKTPAE